MKLRFALRGILAAATLLFFGGCDEHATLGVGIISAPQDVFTGEAAVFLARGYYDGFFSRPTFALQMDWGDGLTTTSKFCTVGDTVRFTHAWQTPGTYAVYAIAMPSTRSQPCYVRVTGANDPAIDSAQIYYRWRPTEVVAYAHHPGGDSLRLVVAWGDGKSDTTGFRPSPVRFTAAHAYAYNGDVKVVLKTLDRSGAASLPETLSAFVTTGGGVTGFQRGTYSGSPVIVGDVVYLVGPDGLYGFRDTSAVYFYRGEFAGQPSVSGQTLYGYIGSQAGYLCAFTQDLTPAWQYPSQDPVPGWQWGPVAVNGNALYVPCSNDSVYCLVDNGSSVTRVAAFGAGQVEVVVLDSAGSVYFGDGSGYLCKLTAGLGLDWRVPLPPGGGILGLVLGGDGTVYCTSDAERVFAVDPSDGSVKWTATTLGVCHQPVVGVDGIYTATAACRLHKFDPNTGQQVWSVRLGQRPLETAPVLVTGGCVYVQTEDDRLYCVRRSSGDSMWVCNASEYLPSLPHGGARQVSVGLSSPTVDADGRLWMVGTDAVYMLATQSSLDSLSPWPKWQHDLYNTGYAGGGK